MNAPNHLRINVTKKLNVTTLKVTIPALVRKAMLVMAERIVQVTLP